MIVSPDLIAEVRRLAGSAGRAFEDAAIANALRGAERRLVSLLRETAPPAGAVSRTPLSLLQESGFSGEKKDKLGRRNCYADGKRVKCAGPTKPAPKEKHTVDSMLAHIESTKQGGMTADKVAALAQHLQHLTVAQLGEVKKKLGVSASGTKAELAKKIAALALGKQTGPVPKKAAPQPVAPAPPPVAPPLDYQQANPDHPVARAILADTETRAVLDKFSGGLDPKIKAAHKAFADSRARSAAAWKDYEDSLPPGSFDEKGDRKADLQLSNKSLRLRHLWTALLTETRLNAAVYKEHLDPVRRHLIAAVKTDQPAQIVAVADKKGDTLDIGGYADRPKETLVFRKPLAVTPELKKDLDRSVDFVSAIASHARVNVLMAQGERRAYYDDKKGHGVLNIGVYREEKDADGESKNTTATVVHELGHALENQKPGVKKVLDDFLAYRLGAEKEQDLERFGMKGEMGRKDHFDRAFAESSAYYIGKVYKSGATEVLSMGLEKLYSDPIGFIEKDPEYAHVIIKCLRMP